jgi:hypothetical protein
VSSGRFPRRPEAEEHARRIGERLRCEALVRP